MWFLGLLQHRKTQVERVKPLVDIHTKQMQEKPRLTPWVASSGTMYWKCRGAGLRGYGMTPEQAYHDWRRLRDLFHEGFERQVAGMIFGR